MPVNSREIVKFVVVTVVLTGLMVLAYWLVE
jgi:CHASE3 domain sensor protein